MTKKIAIFGGSFNPPGIHHRSIAAEISEHFDEVVIVPCGPRPDKPTTNDVEPIARATMTDMTFRNLDRVRVELFDLEQATFTRTHQLEELFRNGGEVWHVVGTDLTTGGKDGKSFIQKTWEKGEEIWTSLRFAVVAREGFEVDRRDLPPCHEVFTVSQSTGASGMIRERAFKHESISGLVTQEVAGYIERYGLYKGALPSRSTSFFLESPRLLIVTDALNPQAIELMSRFDNYKVEHAMDGPNCILVIGGDGTMLHAIRKYWRWRLPFLGVNAGHRGFLLNGESELLEGKFPKEHLTVRQSPLLYTECLPAHPGQGGRKKALAFNDAWVERASSQAAWIEVKVNKEIRLSRMIADGILLSTAAGSTAYARAMGATPLLVETPALLLAGSNVMEPPSWKSVLLSLDSTVEFRSLQPEKRPLEGFVDGISQGKIELMQARVSHTAAVELAFCRGHDMAEKIAEIQFPATR